MPRRVKGLQRGGEGLTAPAPAAAGVTAAVTAAVAIAVTAAILCGSCAFDTTGVAPPAGACGNSVLDPGEQCDDGNTADGDGCDAQCQLEVSPDCGDGTLDPGEQCDDGNTTACDGCSATCQTEGCGNSIVEAACGEQCDDGNTADGDGCDAQCQHEIPPGCGNGILDSGEQCDDGNNLSCDGCSAICQTEGCGNSVVEAECGEQCDDGNTADCDGCSATCQTEGCGNAIIEAACGEQCDDGNTTDCDGCSATCQTEGCGNTIIEAACGEICEPTNLGSDCVAQGYASGTLACGPGCDTYDTSGCLRFDGQDCTTDAQCVSNTCLEETTSGMPAGYCTTDCFFTPCGLGTVCRSLAGWSYCLETCTLSSDCRQGYYCRIDPDQFSALVCLPNCQSDADCPVTNNCNLYNGLCIPDSPLTQGDTGEACTFDWDCRGFCWDIPDGGYCSSPCNTSNPACPGDGICSAPWPGVGDLGICLDGCTTPGDCTRQDYTCEPNPHPGGGSVCF